MKRRNFIKNSAALAVIPAAAFLEKMNENRPKMEHTTGFSLKILNTNWGFGGTMGDFFKKTKDAGYDGVELWLSRDAAAGEEIRKLAAEHKLDFGFLIGGGSSDFNQHYAEFEASLHQAVALKPLYINCHSGRDWFSFEQCLKFIDLTTRVATSSGVPIYHETHRGRIMFAANFTRQFIEKAPELRLTLDISHWCTVHESLLNDQEETVEMAIARTDHIHARVGHSEGPQVNDPRAPEWEYAVKRHLEWWDKVVAIKSKSGQTITMLTEFGPPHYLPALPYTQQPVADQWAINVYMKDLLRKRYL